MDMCTGCKKFVEYECVETYDGSHNLCAECWPEMHEQIEEHMKNKEVTK